MFNKISFILLISFFLSFTSAQVPESRFSHAVLKYPTGKYDTINKELREFLENEAGNYNLPIKIDERDDS